MLIPPTPQASRPGTQPSKQVASATFTRLDEILEHLEPDAVRAEVARLRLLAAADALETLIERERRDGRDLVALARDTRDDKSASAEDRERASLLLDLCGG